MSTTTPTTIIFFVPGIPAPGGSKRFVGIGKRTGRAILIDAGGQRNKDWRANVGHHALIAMEGKVQFERRPLMVNLTFFMPRPKYHFRRDGTLRDDAPRYHTTKPDAIKLARAAEDAMTGIIYRDDALTAAITSAKYYANPDESCGCRVEIMTL